MLPDGVFVVSCFVGWVRFICGDMPGANDACVPVLAVAEEREGEDVEGVDFILRRRSIAF